MFEARPTLRTQGVALSLFANGLSALDALGSGEEVRALGLDTPPDIPAGVRDSQGTWLSRMGSQVVTSARVVPGSELHAVLASRLEQRAGLGTKPPVMARRIQRTMSRTFRPGTWRQAVLTFCAVLPMSLLLNFVVTPILAGWPKLALTVLNATLLVATLNWALLPALNYVTAGGPRPGRRAHSHGHRLAVWRAAWWPITVGVSRRRPRSTAMTGSRDEHAQRGPPAGFRASRA